MSIFVEIIGGFLWLQPVKTKGKIMIVPFGTSENGAINKQTCSILERDTLLIFLDPICIGFWIPFGPILFRFKVAIHHMDLHWLRSASPQLTSIFCWSLDLNYTQKGLTDGGPSEGYVLWTIILDKLVNKWFDWTLTLSMLFLDQCHLKE